MELQINLTYANELADGDLAFKKEFVETFKDAFEQLTAAMSKNLKSKDFEMLGKNAHQLKPSAKMIELPTAKVLEDLQHSPETATEDLIEQIVFEGEAALKQLQSWATTA